MISIRATLLTLAMAGLVLALPLGSEPLIQQASGQDFALQRGERLTRVDLSLGPFSPVDLVAGDLIHGSARTWVAVEIMAGIRISLGPSSSVRYAGTLDGTSTWDLLFGSILVASEGPSPVRISTPEGAIIAGQGEVLVTHGPRAGGLRTAVAALAAPEAVQVIQGERQVSLGPGQALQGLDPQEPMVLAAPELDRIRAAWPRWTDFSEAAAPVATPAPANTPAPTVPASSESPPPASLVDVRPRVRLADQIPDYPFWGPLDVMQKDQFVRGKDWRKTLGIAGMMGGFGAIVVSTLVGTYGEELFGLDEGSRKLGGSIGLWSGLGLVASGSGFYIWGLMER